MGSKRANRPREWERMSLREAGVTLIDCDHRTPPASEAGYPYVAIPQLRAGRIDLSGARRIASEHFVEWTKKAKPSANDVVLSRRCNPGETAFVTADAEFALGQNLVLLRADATRVFPPFLRWIVRGPEWWEEVGKFINVGAVFDSLKCADIPKFELSIPPREEQKPIARILGTLDEKIDLNRRTNETLEGIARAIFKSWFVAFDPVRAKVEGHQLPSMSSEFSALFPHAFADSELGSIPDGWDVRPIGDVVRVLGGSTPSTKQSAYWDGAHFFATPKDLSCLTSPVLLRTERTITDEGVAQISSGVLPVGTVLLSSRAPIGYVAITAVPVSVNQGFIGMVCDQGLPTHYVAQWTSMNVETFKQNAGGTTFAEISKGTFRPLPILVPPEPLLVAYEKTVLPVYERLERNLRERNLLIQLREALLPKLISGEIRMNDVDRFAGA